ncbi:MAG TPA: hypothetical protein VL282_08825, partial [Tepidisphaeraceae bacterium]|nr:hypothetical protein [Tepidisphaeraceae bacterium]
MNVVNKIGDFVAPLRPPPAVRRFMDHNRRVFPQPAVVKARERVVLFEITQFRSAHIAYSYLANVLEQEHDARLIGYVPEFLAGRRQELSHAVRRFVGTDPINVFRSFGASEILVLSATDAIKERAQALHAEVMPALRSNRDVELLTVDGILIGDLIYDSYLMRLRRPTIDLHSREFQGFLLQSLELFVAWQLYFETHDVRAVSVSHCVYNVALPLRIAVSRDIPAYQATVTHLYRLTERNLFAYNDFFYFPERFAALPREVQDAGLAEAERRIARRFSGEVGVDMSYSTKSAFGKSTHARLLRPSSRKKLLVATHCFFDSPHSYGNNTFPDFFEWLYFLGEISKETDYDWYIKTHPDFLPGTKEIIDTFVAKYPKFTLLPSDASHHQIVAEGIDVALTVYGTIAFEYAALGVPVINASPNNPHIAYDFNLHARTIEEYRSLLLDLGRVSRLKIDRRKVDEYYFMRHIFNTDNIFFEHYDRMIHKLGGYYGQFEPGVYDAWLAEWTPHRHRAIVESLTSFVRSGDFRLDVRHTGGEFRVSSKGT